MQETHAQDELPYSTFERGASVAIREVDRTYTTFREQVDQFSQDQLAARGRNVLKD